MKPVNQTICNFKNGNCMQACVASILEVDLDQVPNFMEFGPDEYLKTITEWCKSLGVIVINIDFAIKHDDVFELFEDSYLIASGKSPRDETKNHAVVWKNGSIVHDPHPDKTGLVGEPESFSVFVVVDYSLLNQDGLDCSCSCFLYCS